MRANNLYVSILARPLTCPSYLAVTPLMYNPDAALGSRYTALSNTPIVRTYHAAICQHSTGEVRDVAGR